MTHSRSIDEILTSAPTRHFGLSVNLKPLPSLTKYAAQDNLTHSRSSDEILTTDDIHVEFLIEGLAELQAGQVQEEIKKVEHFAKRLRSPPAHIVVVIVSLAHPARATAAAGQNLSAGSYCLNGDTFRPISHQVCME